jgi:hypothetical protein
MCPDTLANNSVKLNLRDLEAWFDGTLRALAKANIFGAKVTATVDVAAPETMAAHEGCGHRTTAGLAKSVVRTGEDSERGATRGTLIARLTDELSPVSLLRHGDEEAALATFHEQD